jgi:plastocyanin
MKILHLPIITIMVVTCTSFFLIYLLSFYDKQQPMMANLDPLGKVTTVVIPQGAEDQNSGKNYDPQYIRVIIGVNNTVRWINDGDTMNSVVADNSSDPDFYNVTNQFTAIMGNAKTPNFLKPGESFEYTFTKPGYFGYHGVPHPWQRGWILVLTPDQSDEQIPEHVNLGASSFHDTYAVGQKIDFTVELSGYGITCPIPDIVIQKQDGNIIWHANHAPTLCDPEHGAFKIQYKLSDGLGVPTINETGSYVAVVSYDNQTMRLPFSVVSSTSDVKNLSESLPEYASSTTKFGGCDARYPQSNNDIPVLYMPINSTGKICVSYQNPNQPHTAGFEVLEAQNYNKNSDVIVSSNPNVIPQGNTTIVYTIQSSKAGFYRMLITCPGMQLAVGYDNSSTFVSGDFPWLGQTFYCPLQSGDFHIIGLSGIGVKYIPNH